MRTSVVSEFRASMFVLAGLKFQRVVFCCSPTAQQYIHWLLNTLFSLSSQTCSHFLLIDSGIYEMVHARKIKWHKCFFFITVYAWHCNIVLFVAGKMSLPFTESTMDQMAQQAEEVRLKLLFPPLSFDYCAIITINRLLVDSVLWA